MIDFIKTKARDVMRKNVQKLESGMPIDRAIALFEEAHISGAPVVDAQDRVVGVLTLADVANAELAAKSRLEGTSREYAVGGWRGDEEDLSEDEFVSMESLAIDAESGDTVAEWMTQEVVSVRSEASLRDVCRVMAENKIHRVLVVDEKKLHGIVTNSDVVRWIAEHS